MHFRLTKLSSFIRQLHLYDFHKVKNVDCLTFENKLFKKDKL